MMWIPMFILGQQPPPGNQAAGRPAPTDDIYDIVVLTPKESITGFVFWLVLVLVLLLAAGLAVWLWYRKNQIGKNVLSAEIKVTKKLRRIAVDKDDLEPSQFTLRISEALKDYLSEKFDEPVRFETTQEFLQRVGSKGSALPGPAIESLQAFLVTSDEIKFANLADGEERAEPLLSQAAVIVKQCQPTESKAR